eukprot:5439915-Pleurochrysis_carterae.AAC.3
MALMDNTIFSRTAAGKEEAGGTPRLQEGYALAVAVLAIYISWFKSLHALYVPQRVTAATTVLDNFSVLMRSCTLDTVLAPCAWYQVHLKRKLSTIKT